LPWECLADAGDHRRGASAGLVGSYGRREEKEGDEQDAVRAAMVAA